MALLFLHVVRSADADFSQISAPFLEIQRDLFNFGGSDVAIKVSAQRQEVRHRAGSASHFEAGLSLNRSGLEIGSKEEGKITIEFCLQSPIGLRRRGIVFDFDPSLQI